MKYLLISLLAFLFQDLPYKPKEEFEIKLDYKFKQRPADTNVSTINFQETTEEKNRRTSGDVLPYLILNVRVLKLPMEEGRMKISNNLNDKVYTRKIQEGTIVPIDAGFTADIKDRIMPHEYVLTFVNSEKQPTSRIVIFVDKDGTFLVNEEKRGRF